MENGSFGLMQRTEQEVIKGLVSMASDDMVKLKRNIAGNFTIKGRVPEDGEEIYFEFSKLQRIVTWNDEEHEACIYQEGEKKYILKFHIPTKQLVSICEAITDNDAVNKHSILFNKYNSPLINCMRATGTSFMNGYVVPFTTLELFNDVLSVNFQPETEVRKYRWRLPKINGMEVVLKGVMDVKVPEATPPCIITIGLQGNITKIRDNNGDNRLDVEIPNKAEFLKHLYVVQEIRHLDSIKEQ